MLSTLYMAAFAFKYWFHDVPFYRLSRDQSDRERHGEPSVVSPKFLRFLRRVDKVCFAFDTANFALCCLLFLAKCVGALPWW